MKCSLGRPWRRFINFICRPKHKMYNAWLSFSPLESMSVIRYICFFSVHTAIALLTIGIFWNVSSKAPLGIFNSSTLVSLNSFFNVNEFEQHEFVDFIHTTTMKHWPARLASDEKEHLSTSFSLLFSCSLLTGCFVSPLLLFTINTSPTMKRISPTTATTPATERMTFLLALNRLQLVFVAESRCPLSSSVPGDRASSASWSVILYHNGMAISAI